MKHCQMHRNTTNMLQNMSLVPMGWIECILCEKFLCDFVAQTCALIAPVNPFCTEFDVVTKHWQMHPNIMKTHQNKSLGSNLVDRCVCCQKFRWDFVARTFALIAPVQPISHRVSCSNETIQNAPKHYKTHQFMNLASNGMDRVCSL